MGNPGEASKAVVTPREGCVCPVCDLIRFSDWKKRIENILPDSLDDGTPRMELIWEIHATIEDRHPLGIAERLYETIAFLHCAEPEADEDAQALLLEMVNDEKFQLAQPGEFEAAAEECSLAAELEKDRSKIL